jgi:hypothetical protein
VGKTCLQGEGSPAAEIARASDPLFRTPKPANSTIGTNPHDGVLVQGVIGMSQDPFALGQAGADFHG